MSGIATLIFLIVLGLLTIPSGSIFRHPETDSLIVLSPFLFSLVPIITLFFMNAGLFYGVGSGVIKSDRDAIRCMIEGVKSMSGFIVFAFFAGQMIAWFDWSRIGPVVAIKGANFLQNIGFEGIPLLLMFILITSLINIMISSNSAKFAILAPVFIPMFMLMGISPSGTTIAYRIADSITNPITPMMVYLAIIISIAKQYDEKFGIGSVIASVLPYSIAFTVMWVLQLIIWYVLKLPLGPGFYFQM